MSEWGWPTKTERTGTLDDLRIKAAPGVVEISWGDEWSGGMFGIPSALIDEFVLRLTTARDAAALMQSGGPTK